MLIVVQSYTMQDQQQIHKRVDFVSDGFVFMPIINYPRSLACNFW